MTNGMKRAERALQGDLHSCSRVNKSNVSTIQNMDNRAKVVLHILPQHFILEVKLEFYLVKG